MGSLYHSQAIRPDTAYLKKVIESSLLADWAIRIEYQSCDSETGDWQLWQQAHFAIRSAKPVIDTLLDCYTRNPKSTIRICAEKFYPTTRMFYTVYNPLYVTDHAKVNASTNTRQIAQPYEQPTTLTRLSQP